MIYGTQDTLYLRQLVQATRNSYKACGYQQITVDGTVQSLTLPSNAIYALMSLESSATGIAVRYLELGSSITAYTPTTALGIGKSTLDVWDVVDTANLVNFRITQAQAGTHTLNIQYYSFE